MRFSGIDEPLSNALPFPPHQPRRKSTHLCLRWLIPHTGTGSPHLSFAGANVLLVDDNATASKPSYPSKAQLDPCTILAHPQFDRRGPVLTINKFPLKAMAWSLLLGVLVDSRKLTVAWLIAECFRLQGRSQRRGRTVVRDMELSVCLSHCRFRQGRLQYAVD